MEGNRIAKKLNLEEFFYFSGIACSPNYNCFDAKKNNSLEFMLGYSFKVDYDKPVKSYKNPRYL